MSITLGEITILPDEGLEQHTMVSTRDPTILRPFHKQETPDLSFGIIHTTQTVHYPRFLVTSGLGYGVTCGAILSKRV